MKIHGILLILLSGCLFQATGQDRNRFHSDPELFIREATEFFGAARPEESKAILLKLEEARKGSLLEENQWIDLAAKSNTLEKSGARAYPDFHLLLSSFLEVSGIPSGRSSYFAWSGYLGKLLAENGKNIRPSRDFMEFTLGFCRSRILYKSTAFVWKAGMAPFEFGMDSSFYVSISQSNLVVSGSGDSAAILSTRGRYYPLTEQFYGENGRVTWERVGIPVSRVYANLGKYRLDLSRAVYEIDTVNLLDSRYFREPIPGKLENKIQPGISPENATYPKFTSFELRNRIKNIYPGMDYEGGFSLQGAKVLGTGNAGRKSILTVFRNDKPLLRLASTYFSFQSEQARGINTEASIYLDTDSIYHPGLLFLFNQKQNEISLIRDGEGISPSRYLNSYHGYDMNVDWIRWHPGDSVMTLTGLPGSSENKASFESSEFFNIDRYNEILVADKVHPVTAVKQCADYYYSRNFTLEDLSKFMNKPQHLVEEMLLRLSFLGFVRYNSETRLVEVEERAYDFLKKNAGQQDYDVIRFQSSHQQPDANGILNLNNNRLTVSWVKSVTLSEVRNVVIYPENERVVILKGRDMLFDGQIQGGLIRFYGTTFRFNYQDFAIRLDNVGQMKIQVFEKPEKKDELPKLADVTSVIEYTRGFLKIDDPGNKSGVKAKDLPEYPILKTDTTAYVYYDQKEILNGIYPRKTFNFNIFPFTLKGLNLYTFSDSLVFPGLFVTADIFPPMELALRHQTDHSLGFETLKTPEEGYPVYKGKGRFYNSIAMSRAGLRGAGRLEYLNSVLVSQDFLFLPDRVSTIADVFAVNRDTTGRGNPETKGQKMDVTWYPEDDRLVARGTKEPLNMYGGRFDGELSLQPQSLTGKGTIRFDGYSVTSDTLRFFETRYEVVEGDLRVFRGTPEQQSDTTQAADVGNFLIARKFNGEVDVTRQLGKFAPAGSKSGIVFTKNRFEAKPESMGWDINRGLVTMEKPILKMASKPSDSLNFLAGKADFTTKDLTIRAHEVEFIDVADVRVFPADREVAVRRFARIDSLVQATIVSRDTALMHRITGATVSVIDHRRYNAHGNYIYKDVAGREFPIHFADIQPDRKGVSFGKGNIAEDNKFSLSPAFRYFGPVQWNNNQKYLLFTGQAQLSHECPGITLQWIRFSSRICPDSVAIPIDSVTVNDQNERLFKGFFISNQPVELYSTFIGPHLRYSDQPLISATGLLWYDEPSATYRLTTPEKKANPDTDGPLLTLDAKNCITEGAGKLDFGVDLGQVKLTGAGKLVHDIGQDTITGSAIMAVDFFFDPKLLAYVAKSLNDAAGLDPVNFSDPSFRQAFRSLVGQAEGDELLKQISLTGKWKKIPDQLMHTIVFTDVKFSWNKETGSYMSNGKIGVGNILGEPVNKKLDGYIEIVHRRGGDVLSMYLGVNSRNYFFFTYSRGVMQCVAGADYEKFNATIRSTKEAKRTLKVEPGETEYQYYIGTYAIVSQFLRKFNIQR